MIGLSISKLMNDFQADDHNVVDSSQQTAAHSADTKPNDAF